MNCRGCPLRTGSAGAPLHTGCSCRIVALFSAWRRTMTRVSSGEKTGAPATPSRSVASGVSICRVVSYSQRSVDMPSAPAARDRPKARSRPFRDNRTPEIPTVNGGGLDGISFPVRSSQTASNESADASLLAKTTTPVRDAETATRPDGVRRIGLAINVGSPVNCRFARSNDWATSESSRTYRRRSGGAKRAIYGESRIRFGAPPSSDAM
jgi:hypothetical protein